MDVYIPLGLLFFFVCFLQKSNPSATKHIFYLSMIIVWMLLSIRYEFGPDYSNYRNIYDEIQGEDIENYTGLGQSVESLFLRFLQLFPNFTSFVVLLTTFWFATNVFFIRRYVESKYYWIVILYLFFGPSYMLASTVAMRTTLCGCLFLVALVFLLRGRRLLYIAIIILSSLIHSSTIVLIIFAFFSLKSNSVLFKSWFIVGAGVLAIFSFILGENVINNFTQFLIDNLDTLEQYSSYELGGVSRSFNTLLFKMMSFCILLYLVFTGRRETDYNYLLMYKIGIVVATLILLMGQTIISDRFLLILNPVFIIALIRSIKKNDQKINLVIFAFLMVISIYIFYSKMSQSYSESFLHYQTIFAAPFIP